MGASGSIIKVNGEELPVQDVLQQKIQALEAETLKADDDVNTPRGVSAKAEVIHLRALMKKTLEEDIILREYLQHQNEQEEEDEEEDGPDLRVGCCKCERKFAPDRLEKHQNVCKGTKKAFTEDVPAGDIAADGTPVVDTPAVETTGEVPKWKQDREKMKEQLKKDRSKPALDQPQA